LRILEDDAGETVLPVNSPTLPNGNICDIGADDPDGKQESLPELNNHRQESSRVEEERKRPRSPPSLLPQQQEQPCTN